MKTIIANDGDTLLQFFDSLADLRRVEFPNAKNEKRWNHTQREERDSVDWWGIEGGAAGVDNALINGWPEGYAKAKEYFAQLTVPTLPSMRRTPHRGREGDYLDYHAVLAGNLDRAWTHYRRDMREDSTARCIITLDVGGNCTRKSEEMFWRGAVVLRLAEEMINSGRAVKIIAGDSTNSYSDDSHAPTYSENYVTIKDFHHPMAPEFIAVCAALSGFFRRWLFKAICLATHDVNSGLGRHKDFRAECLERHHLLTNITTINCAKIWTYEDAQAWLDDQTDHIKFRSVA